MAVRPSKAYVEDIGTIIILDTANNISSATKLEIHVLKPDGREEKWTAVLDQSKNTRLRYVTSGHGDPGYQSLGLTITGSEDSGLLADRTYYFTVNGKDYNFKTDGFSTPISFNNVIAAMNSALTNFSVSVVDNDIRVSSNLVGKDATVLLENPEDALLPLFSSLNGFNIFNDAVDPIIASFDIPGRYNLQAYVEMPAWQGHGETVVLQVYDRYK